MSKCLYVSFAIAMYYFTVVFHSFMFRLLRHQWLVEFWHLHCAVKFCLESGSPVSLSHFQTLQRFCVFRISLASPPTHIPCNFHSLRFVDLEDLLVDVQWMTEESVVAKCLEQEEWLRFFLGKKRMNNQDTSPLSINISTIFIFRTEEQMLGWACCCTHSVRFTFLSAYIIMLAPLEGDSPDAALYLDEMSVRVKPSIKPGNRHCLWMDEG